MKFIILLALIAAASCSTQLLKTEADLSAEEQLSIENAQDFLRGFVEGLGVYEDINSLKQCLKGVQGLISTIKQALPYLRQLNAQSLKQGLQILFGGIRQFLSSLKPCAQSGSVIHKLLNIMSRVNLAKLALKIITNPVRFVQDVGSAVNCFAHGDHYCGGRAIGDILRILFL